MEDLKLSLKERNRSILQHKRIVSIISFCIVFIIGFSCFVVYAFYEKARIAGIYEDGVKAYEDGDYDEAIELLNTIGDYQDAIQYIENAERWNKYSEAISYYESGDYEEAYQLFVELGDFENSRQYLIKTQLPEVSRVQADTYQEAMDYYENKDYEKAKVLFEQLTDYKNSQVMIIKCENGEKRLELATTVCAGVNSTVAVSVDGSVYITDYYDRSNVNFSNWRDIVSISCHGYLYIGLDGEGRVYSTGKFGNLDTDVNGKPGWDEEFIAVAAGEQYIIGLKADGTVLHLGRNYEDQKDCEKWKDIVYIASGRRTIVGLDKDGRIHVAGQDAAVLQEYVDDHSEWFDLKSIDVGGSGEKGDTHIVGLLDDGSVIAYMSGKDKYGKCQVEKWDEIVTISAGENHTVGITKDKRVVIAGNDGTKEYPGKEFLDKTKNWENVIAISAGTNYTVSVMTDKDGNNVICGAGYEDQGQIEFAGWNDVRVW